MKEVLENGLELGKALQTQNKWGWNIEAKCYYIMYKILVEKNLQEASELIANDNFRDCKIGNGIFNR